MERDTYRRFVKSDEFAELCAAMGGEGDGGADSGAEGVPSAGGAPLLDERGEVCADACQQRWVAAFGAEVAPSAPPPQGGAGGDSGGGGGGGG
eukprot:7012476-Prymnesium_polylepis.1